MEVGRWKVLILDWEGAPVVSECCWSSWVLVDEDFGAASAKP